MASWAHNDFKAPPHTSACATLSSLRHVRCWITTGWAAGGALHPAPSPKQRQQQQSNQNYRTSAKMLEDCRWWCPRRHPPHLKASKQSHEHAQHQDAFGTNAQSHSMHSLPAHSLPQRTDHTEATLAHFRWWCHLRHPPHLKPIRRPRRSNLRCCQT
jgi:hypothetical protein